MSSGNIPNDLGSIYCKDIFIKEEGITSEYDFNESISRQLQDVSFVNNQLAVKSEFEDETECENQPQCSNRDQKSGLDVLVNVSFSCSSDQGQFQPNKNSEIHSDDISETQFVKSHQITCEKFIPICQGNVLIKEEMITDDSSQDDLRINDVNSIPGSQAVVKTEPIDQSSVSVRSEDDANVDWSVSAKTETDIRNEIDFSHSPELHQSYVFIVKSPSRLQNFENVKFSESKTFGEKLNEYVKNHSTEQLFQILKEIPCRQKNSCKTNQNPDLQGERNENHVFGSNRFQFSQFECHICRVIFSQQSDLNVHLKTHEKNFFTLKFQTFECHMCSERFSQKVDLNVHLKTHLKKNFFGLKFRTDEIRKSFECDICNKRFEYSHHLIAHLQAHKNENNKICRITFSQQSGLNSHLQKPEIKKKFECEICPKKYVHKRSLTRHLKSHSSENQQGINNDVNSVPKETQAVIKIEPIHQSSISLRSEDDLTQAETQAVIKIEPIHQSSISVRSEDHTNSDCSSLEKIDVEISNEIDFSHSSEFHESETVKSQGFCEFENIRYFDCIICEEKFLQKSKLTEHLQNHSDRELFEPCKENSQKSELNFHLQTHSSQNSSRNHLNQQLECEICKKKFSKKSLLDFHLQLHKGDKPFECEICRKKFALKSYLNNHLQIHNSEKSFECDLCKKKFLTKSNLKIHLLIHQSDKSFECKICGKKFTQRSHLKVHLKLHEGEKPFDCEICGKKFVQKSYLNAHLQTHESEKPFECKICSKKLSRKSTLNDHLKTHESEKPFECELCRKRFSSKITLKFHLKSGNHFKREICKKNVKQSATVDFQAHENRFRCDICGKNFAQKNHLKSHLESHGSENQYECEICSGIFSRKRSLKAHLLHHKPRFQCHVCEKKLTRKSDLNFHVEYHLSENNRFECEICKKKYSLKGSLKAHLQSHKNKNKFECEICKKRFSWKAVLKTHFLRFHVKKREKREKREMRN